MTEELPDSYSLMCSGCHTPCTGADAHVVPRWNPALRKVLTTYRCGNCWVQSLEELRGQVVSGDAEEQEAVLLAIVDAVQDGRLMLEP